MRVFRFLGIGDTSGDTSPNVSIKFEPALSAAQQIFHALGLDQDAMLRHYNTPASYPSRNRPERDPGSFSQPLARDLRSTPFETATASPNFSIPLITYG